MEKIALTDPGLLKTDGYIDGAWLGSDKRFDVINPATGGVIAQVADLTRADAARAIDAAEDARHAWAAKTAKERSDILRRWGDLMMAAQDDLALILTTEMGKPLAEAKGEIAYGASFVFWFAEEARRVYGETIPGHQPDKRLMVIKQPVGVAASITPWNFPNAMITRKAAPALAAGCSFVARPASQTPLSALAMAELAERAGIPKGVFNMIPSDDASGVGQEFCENFKVRKVTFTGSTGVGQILMRQSATDLKKMSLELGGNAPFLVFDDADIDAAVEGAMIAKFRNGGQTCVCANRIFVQAGIYDAFAEKLAAAVGALKLGDGREPGVQVGPMIEPKAVEKVEDHIADAVSKGAVVKVGGQRHGNEGTWFQPTLITEVVPGMKLMKEETFGPLAPLVKFETEEEAVALANDTEYGLASYFYSRDLGRVYRVMEALDYGMVGVNTGLISTAEAPFGGVKRSGLGREGSRHGIDEYLEMKYVCMSV